MAQAGIESFGVGKKLDYLQNSSATPTSHTIIGDPAGPFHFSAVLGGTNLNLLNPVPKVTLPNSTQYTLTGNSFLLGVAPNYTGKAALDAAFPNGAYSFAAGSSTMPITLGASDSYPVQIPQVVGGTWDSQGKLVISAASGATLNFNTFSDYPNGMGGIIRFNLFAVSGTTLVSELAAVKSVALSGYPADPALTSYTISAGLLQADRTYYAELTYARIVDLNTTFLPAVGTGTFLYTTGLMISTAAPVVAPAITTQPVSQTVTVGANVVLSVVASGNPAPIFQWRKDGMNIVGATISSFALNNVQLVDGGSYSVVASNTGGISTSESALLTINPTPVSPVITLQPVSQTVTEGTAVNFTATASGVPSPGFQWKKNGAVIGGATAASYAINSPAISDAGNYTVVATNSAGAATSNVAALTVKPTPVAPVITLQPVGQTLVVGHSVNFVVGATGTPAPTFQWHKGSLSISGATNATYLIASATEADVGVYSVVVTNIAGSVPSNEVPLAFVIAPSDAVISFSVE